MQLMPDAFAENGWWRNVVTIPAAPTPAGLSKYNP
jgi:hypothetical protein